MRKKIDRKQVPVRKGRDPADRGEAELLREIEAAKEELREWRRWHEDLIRRSPELEWIGDAIDNLDAPPGELLDFAAIFAELDRSEK